MNDIPTTSKYRAGGLTRAELAEYAGVTDRTVDRWRKLGIVHSVKIGGTVRIPESEITRLFGRDEQADLHEVARELAAYVADTYPTHDVAC